MGANCSSSNSNVVSQSASQKNLHKSSQPAHKEAPDATQQKQQQAPVAEKCDAPVVVVAATVEVVTVAEAHVPLASTSEPQSEPQPEPAAVPVESAPEPQEDNKEAAECEEQAKPDDFSNLFHAINQAAAATPVPVEEVPASAVPADEPEAPAQPAACESEQPSSSDSAPCSQEVEPVCEPACEQVYEQPCDSACEPACEAKEPEIEAAIIETAAAEAGVEPASLENEPADVAAVDGDIAAAPVEASEPVSEPAACEPAAEIPSSEAVVADEQVEAPCAAVEESSPAVENVSEDRQDAAGVAPEPEQQ